jgi:hypothetical protein
MVLSAFINSRWLLAVASGAMACATYAQTATPTPATSSTPYPSAFERYKPYTDETIGNWKAANDTTARIGGWREYARQAQQPESTPATSLKTGETVLEPVNKAKP